MVAAWPGTAAAQVVPVRPDSAAAVRDSLARDSARAEAERQQAARQRALADTLRAPLARAEVPVVLSVGPPWAWDRDPLWSTGALTLGELVDRVPGVSTFRSGWIAAPEMAAYLGAFGRIRVFMDGVELDGLNARMDGQLDLSMVDLWHLEDATIEPGADEVRVHLRSWRVTSTIPATRIDINTGDLRTNVFRGFYGRRFPSGHVLQLGGNHYSTTNQRTEEEGDQTSIWGRAGWASGRWTVDGTVLRSGRKYTERLLEEATFRDTLPTLDGESTIATARVGWGEPGRGTWAQAIASHQSFRIRRPSSTVIDSIPGPDGGGPGGSPESPDTIEVSNDTTRSRPQFLLTGGWGRGPLQLSAAGRLRRWQGASYLSPSLRASWTTGSLVAGAFAERAPLDSVQRLEGSVRVALPLNLAASGAISRSSPIESGARPTSTALRAELGVRAGRLWLSGGIMTRDTANLPAAVAFDSTFRDAFQGPTTGTFATARGKFYRDVGLDLVAVRYDAEGAFRPQYETRSRIYVDSDMRSRFPSGNLNILLAVTHEYRTQALFPTRTGSLRSTQYRTWGAELEIRLLSATVTFLYRNFLGAEYQQVPGFTMPGITSYYGVRWNFVN